MKQQVLDCFAKLFGGEGDIRTYFAPGRVNLIGEHTDYNGGHAGAIRNVSVEHDIEALLYREALLAKCPMLRDMFGYDTISMIDIALYGQFSENNYNGVNCGIMDQFAIAMGKKDCAIFLDTSDLKYEYAPVKLEGARIVISCSNKKRGLGDSKYNERAARASLLCLRFRKSKTSRALAN